MPSITISASNCVDAWVKLKDQYAKIRGFTIGPNKTILPLLYGFDMPDLVNYWNRQIPKITRSSQETTAIQRWYSFVSSHNAFHSTPYLIFSAYPQFWEESDRLALALDAARVVPSSFSLVWESVKESASDFGSAAVKAGKVTLNIIPDIFGAFGGTMKWIFWGSMALGAVYILKRK